MRELEKELSEEGEINKSTLKQVFIDYFDLDGDGKVSLMEIQFKGYQFFEFLKDLKGLI